MPLKDPAGYQLSHADSTSLEAFERACHELRCYIGDPVATIDGALAGNPAFVMGHAMRAYLHLLGTEPAGLPVARASFEAAQTLPAHDRESRHLRAIGHLVEGRWRAAGRELEDLSIEYPRDALALQAGHQVDFFTGDSRMLRDRIARALPAWSRGLPGYHAVLGMYAFGLEESGDYARAELLGRRAVEMEPRDGWAQHAVAHVMEMQGRRRDGVAWMRGNADSWSRESFFAVHNFWHLALFHLGRGETDEALALFDGPVRGGQSEVVLDMIDASSLLWRLMLRGVNVGGRWEALAQNWVPLAAARNYAFNDVHAMMAFVGAGMSASAKAVLQAQRAAIEADNDNAEFTREVGYPAARAIKAFGDGEYAECVRLLRLVRNKAHRFGGSHAQRDLIDLTLIEAAQRGGQDALARALLTEREEARPLHSPALQKAA